MRIDSPPRHRGPGISLLLTVLFSSCLLLGGCYSGDSFVHLTGTVTYNGKPVPAGTLTFSPDTSQGNSGHGSMAVIRDGKYSTRESLGLVGGPHVVRIEGFDGIPNGDNLDGRALFRPYEKPFDLPKESGQFDFAVPGK